jgi:hypothetical protein
MKLNKISAIFVATTLLLFSSCGKKTTSTVTPTPIPELVELKLDQKPYISLVPSSDGHEINLKISEISNVIKEIDYELVYRSPDRPVLKSKKELTVPSRLIVLLPKKIFFWVPKAVLMAVNVSTMKVSPAAILFLIFEPHRIKPPALKLLLF